MTGSQIKGRSFRGALRYNLEKVQDKRAEILDRSFANTSEKGIMKEVDMVRMLRPNLKKHFYHTSINFPKGEQVDDDLMKKIGRDYLAANGFNQHQQAKERNMTKNEIQIPPNVPPSSIMEFDLAMRDRDINTTFKIPKSLSDPWRIILLATLLDSYNRGRDLGAANAPDL